MTDSFPLTDDALAEWAKRNPHLSQQMHTDAGLHRQFQVNRVVLSHVERAMVAEGIARDVRRRVINTALFGAPDPDEVLSADQVRRMSEELAPETNLEQVRAERGDPPCCDLSEAAPCEADDCPGTRPKGCANCGHGELAHSYGPNCIGNRNLCACQHFWLTPPNGEA